MMRLLVSAGRTNDETFRLGTQSGEEQSCTYVANRVRRAAASAARAGLVERSALPAPRLEQERRVIEQLIHARTQELNRINPGWDEKVGVVLSAEVKPETLDSLSRQSPKEDFYLLRLISEHPKVSAKTLGRLSHHPYSAIRENIARHPNSDAATLSRLSKDRTQPLWYLVAFNPNAPVNLRKKLQERMRRLGRSRLRSKEVVIDE